jgi:mannitol-1-phosphate/altronate dehydrogenase
LIKFIAEKMEDHSMEQIMEAIMNEEKLALMTTEYEE